MDVTLSASATDDCHPKGWVSCSLREVAPLQRGFDLPRSKRREGAVPVVYSNGVENFHSHAMVKGPGVVTGRSGTLGKVHYVEADFWPHNTSLWVTSFRGNVPRFVYYLFTAVGFERFASGSGVPTLNRSDAHAFRVVIPSDKDEQRRISDALSSADAWIKSLRELLAKKRQIKQGAMQELLTGRRRLPGFDDRWCIEEIGALLTIRHGKSQREVEDASGTFPILATGGRIGTASRPLWDKPSVLIGRKGTIDRPQYMDTPFWSVDTLFYSEVHAPNVAKFLYYRFLLIDWQRYNEASGVPSLNAQTIEKIEILVPQAAEQRAIVEVLSSMDAEIAELESKVAKVYQLKEGMMQALLTGAIRLPVDAAA